jgi:glycosyltransferase involved in cell wall biosynthesis
MIYEWRKKYNVRVLSNYGVQASMIGLNGVYIYSNLPDDHHGDKTARLIFPVWKPDLFIVMYDIWMGAYVEGLPPRNLVPIHPHWIPVVMVDHDPIPESTLLSASVAYRRVTPTQFGVDQFKQHGLDCKKIPFGIDTKNFRPVVDEEERRQGKPWLNTRAVPFDMGEHTPIDEDCFLIHICGANKDAYRKAFMRSFVAIQIFLEQNPDAWSDLRVYVHSWMKMARDIPHGAKTLRIHSICRGTADYHNLTGVPPAAMGRIARTADLFLHPTQGGGFEIPVLEALSSGVPAATTDFLGLPELIGRDSEARGWLLPYINKGETRKGQGRYFSPLDATQAIVDEYAMADAIEDAYNHPGQRKLLGERGRKYAEGLDWSIVNQMWYDWIEELREDWKYIPLEKRRL